MITGIAFRDKDAPVPKLWDFFPELFKSEKEAYDKLEADRAMEIYKAKMMLYTERFNARIKGENGDG